MKYIGHYDIDTDGRQTRSLSPAARNKMAYVVETIAGLEPVEIISPSVVTGAISDGGRVEKLSDKVSLRLFPSLGRKSAVLGKLGTLLTTLCFEFYLLTHIHRGETVIALSKLLPQDFQCVVVGAKAHTVESIVTIPFVADQQELALLYNIADVMVMASKCDNYPTVCLEANCCGTPVVGFDVGGVKETIFPGMGMVVPYGDLEQLLSAVVSFAGRKQAIPPEVIQECHARNSKNRMVQDYLSLFQKAL